MGTYQMTPADQAAAALVCVCGASADKHYAKDHPFMERWAYDPATWKRAARYGRDDLNPATNLYITVEDRMRIQTLTWAGVTELDVVARIQRPDGQVIPMRQQLAMAFSSVIQTFEFDLCEGFLLDVSLSTPQANARVGSCFASVQLIRGAGANAQPSRSLIAGYVSSLCVIGWPEGPNQQSVQGAGLIASRQTANPAAGAEVSISILAGQRWLVQSISFQLVTGPGVANRVPHIQLKDAGGNVMWDCAAPAAQVASTTTRYSFCGGVQPVSADGSVIIPIPDTMQMLQGWTFNTVTTALQAADQYQNIWSNVIQWIEN